MWRCDRRSAAHQHLAQLAAGKVPKLGAADCSKDGFSFSLDVSQIIHIGMKNAPRVISRVGSMQNLVDHVLQPTVGNYFRNSAQQVTVLDFLWARSERQKEAFLASGFNPGALSPEAVPRQSHTELFPRLYTPL